MNANLELYRIFCEVVKYKNISKAAENIYISQSAVTQSIQKLEKILGGKLFFRNKNGVELTEEGKNLYEYIGDSIEKMNNAENLFSQYINLEKGIIRICGGKFLVNKYVMPSLVGFIKDYPNIDIRISRATTQESLKKLSNGEIDIAMLNLSDIPTEYTNIDFISLKSTPRYCFIATNDYIKENKISKDSNFENCKIIIPKSTALKQHLKEYCSQNNIDIAPNYEIGDTELIDRLVLNNCGVLLSNIEYEEELLKRDDIQIIKEFQIGEDNKSIATLKKNMDTDQITKKAGMEFHEGNLKGKIVGVTRDFMVNSFFTPQLPVIMFGSDRMSYCNFTVRVSELTPEYLREMNDKIAELFPNEDVGFTVLKTIIESQYEGTRHFRDGVFVASIAILLITLMGLLGYITDEMHRRSKEIAIRKVNGATAPNILRLLSKDVLITAFPAILLGVIASRVVGESWLRQFADKIPLTVFIFISTALLVLAIIWGCVILKSWNIANENPVRSIKNE